MLEGFATLLEIGFHELQLLTPFRVPIHPAIARAPAGADALVVGFPPVRLASVVAAVVLSESQTAAQMAVVVVVGPPVAVAVVVAASVVAQHAVLAAWVAVPACVHPLRIGMIIAMSVTEWSQKRLKIAAPKSTAATANKAPAS